MNNDIYYFALNCKDNFSLLTWNIFGHPKDYDFENRIDKICEKIKELGHDIVLLQEVSKIAYKYIVEKLSSTYIISEFHKARIGQVVLSKININLQKILHFNENKHCIFTIYNNLCIVNVHLNSSRRPDAQDIRIETIKKILKMSSSYKKIIIAGDFNLNEQNQKLMFEKIEELNNFIDINSDYTFDPLNNPLANGESPRRFDKIWCKNLKVISSKVIINYLSDHYALSAQLSLYIY